MLDLLLAGVIAGFAERHPVFEQEKTNFMFWFSLLCGAGGVLLLWAIVLGLAGYLPFAMLVLGILYFLSTLWMAAGVWDVFRNTEDRHDN